jgi:hypothetical protein
VLPIQLQESNQVPLGRRIWGIVAAMLWLATLSAWSVSLAVYTSVSLISVVLGTGLSIVAVALLMQIVMPRPISWRMVVWVASIIIVMQVLLVYWPW